jgi:hypothetical protein
MLRHGQSVQREGSTEFLVLRILATVPLQTSQYVQKFLEFHIKAVRDHTRGLLEVTPSVPASAEHPFHDVTLVCIHAHGILPALGLDNPVCSQKGACSGEPALTPPPTRRVIQDAGAY